MDEWNHVALSRWPWVAPIIAAAAALWRWWSGRRGSARPERRPERWEDAEAVLFPSERSGQAPGRGLARWLSAPARLALKEAGESALEEEIAGLRDDLRRTQADNKRLRGELASLANSNAGSIGTGGDKNPRSRTPRPRSPRSGG